MEEQKQVSVEQTSNGAVTTERRTATLTNRGMFQSYYIVYYILGIFEVLLAARFILRLLGAGSSGGFVSFIYSVTEFLAAPFLGIFNTATNQGAVTSSVFEPATLIAMVVYALVAWGLAKLIAIMMAGKS